MEQALEILTQQMPAVAAFIVALIAMIRKRTSNVVDLDSLVAAITCCASSQFDNVDFFRNIISSGEFPHSEVFRSHLTSLLTADADQNPLTRVGITQLLQLFPTTISKDYMLLIAFAVVYK
jgi:hypothetical protein